MANATAPPRQRQSREVLHRLIDVVGGAALFLCGLLLAPAIVLLIRLDGRGPIFFGQERLGKGGKPFRLWKFRTMVPNAHKLPAPARKGPDDPRMTRAGRWLRRTSLDELPQARNILRGDMGLVGPRPLSAVETADLGPDAWQRLAVRPGLTGLWQVSGRSDLPPDQLLKMDLLYVTRRSPWLDLWILLRTLPAVLSGRGAY